MSNPFVHHFGLDANLIYLNHAAVAPWPIRTAEAVKRFAEENLSRGSMDYGHWLEVERDLRRQAAQLLGSASPDDVALVKNTSEGLSFVAHGLDWRAGDNLVLFAQEFPSNRIVWESLAEYGVEVRLVDLSQCRDNPELALLARCDERTRLITLSSVQYADGLRMDLERIGAFCRANGILFCVDAIQSLGALPFDVARVQADFVAADGHKWMFGPEGLGIFWSRPEVREQLRLRQFGWHMVEHPGDFDRRDWRPAAGATRFECGSPNLLGAHALHASLSLLLEVGIETVERKVRENTAWLIDRIAADSNLELLSDPRPERRSGIVTFRPKSGEIDLAFRLLTENRVICAKRGGGVRFSPHFHNNTNQFERALALLR